jgi:hypothetical protein
MRHALNLLLMSFAVTSLVAQNLQVHYDLKDDRNNIITFIEQFKPDDHGATYWFAQMTYDANDGLMNSGYWEFARYFHVSDALPIDFTLQFNDGLAFWGNMGQAYLTGVNYTLMFGEFALPIDLLYRRDMSGKSNEAQFTTSWFHPMMDGKLLLNGYFDAWTVTQNGDRELNVLTEPAIWYQVKKPVYLGSKIEISYNLMSPQEWKYYPTIALRWDW